MRREIALPTETLVALRAGKGLVSCMSLCSLVILCFLPLGTRFRFHDMILLQLQSTYTACCAGQMANKAVEALEQVSKGPRRVRADAAAKHTACVCC